jgi:hypothetical protein
MFKQILIALDQLLNTLVYIKNDGWGFADEMISARAFRCYIQDYISDKMMQIIDTLFFWDDNHCYECWVLECERKQLPNNYRN